MTQTLILCRSLSYAQKAARALERAGFTAYAVKAPMGLTGSGCGYGVSVRKNAEEALRLLEREGIPHGKLFRRENGGEYREVTL